MLPWPSWPSSSPAAPAPSPRHRAPSPFRIDGVAGLLREGSNELTLTLTPSQPGPCGVYADGVISRFVPHSRRRTNSSESASLPTTALPPGTVVIAEQSATNNAGLAATARTGLIMLDSSPPYHPPVHACTAGGVAAPDGVFYQRSNASFVLCWDAAAGTFATYWLLVENFKTRFLLSLWTACFFLEC